MAAERIKTLQNTCNEVTTLNYIIHSMQNILLKNQLLENSKNENPINFIRMLRSGTLSYRPRFGKRTQNDIPHNMLNSKDDLKLSEENGAYFG